MIHLHVAPNSVSNDRRMRFIPARLAVVAAVVMLTACRGVTDPVRPSVWSTIVAGGSYSCGLSMAGEAFCWGGVGGYFDPMPLQDSVAPNSAVPVRVPGGRRFIDIAVAELSFCALDSQRLAYCWGANLRGEVGDGSHLAKLGPSPVSGGFQWRMLAAGGAHVCGISLGGQTYCWGNQFRGALGNGQIAIGTNPQPVAVSGGLTFGSVYAGTGTSCGLTLHDDAYCWGVNDHGKLGDGEPAGPNKASAVPIRVVGGHRFASLSLGGDHVCGITRDARAYCWGWNRYGQLGNGTTSHASSPIELAGDLRWASLAVGEFHTCGLTTERALYCWGNNERGQFGNGTTDNAPTPQLVAPAGSYISVTAGARHTCGLTAIGTAYCWGRGDFGQLGNGVMADSARPTRVADYQ